MYNKIRTYLGTNLNYRQLQKQQVTKMLEYSQTSKTVSLEENNPYGSRNRVYWWFWSKVKVMWYNLFGLPIVRCSAEQWCPIVFVQCWCEECADNKLSLLLPVKIPQIDRRHYLRKILRQEVLIEYPQTVSRLLPQTNMGEMLFLLISYTISSRTSFLIELAIDKCQFHMHLRLNR